MSVKTAEAANAPQGTGLLTKAFDVIDVISLNHGLLGTREISEETGIARPTLYRILSALTARGFVRYDPKAQTYHIGYRALDIAQKVWSSSDLTSISASELRRLRDVTGETAYLAVAERDNVLSIGRFEGSHPHRSSAKLGSLKPMHCTSQGKVLLAFMPAERREHILALERDAFTQHTLVTREALDAELRTVQNRGYAIDDEEIVLGTRCIGAPIIDRDGNAIAAISIAGPTFRITHERVRALAKELMEVARIIGSQVVPAAPMRSRRSEFFPISKHPAFSGAAPVWDTANERLLWIDQLAPVLMESSTDGTRVLRDFPTRIETMALTERFGPFVFFGRTAVRTRDGAEYPLPLPVQAAAAFPADDKMLLALKAESDTSALLVVMTHDGRLSDLAPVPGPVSGLHIGTDGKTVYIASAQRGTITLCDTGTGGSRVLARVPEASGKPQACALDTAGRLWVALSNGWSVARIDELGEIAERMPMPVPNPMGLCFGGSDGRELFVTTARIEQDRSDLTNAPLSGHTLRFVD